MQTWNFVFTYADLLDMSLRARLEARLARAREIYKEAKERHPEWHIKRADNRPVHGDYKPQGDGKYTCFDGRSWVKDIISPMDFFEVLDSRKFKP